jgi:hypothetical protein
VAVIHLQVTGEVNVSAGMVLSKRRIKAGSIQALSIMISKTST